MCLSTEIEKYMWVKKTHVFFFFHHIVWIVQFFYKLLVSLEVQ